MNGAVCVSELVFVKDVYWNFHHQGRVMSQGFPKCMCFDFTVTGPRGGPWLAASPPLIGLHCSNATIHQEELSVCVLHSLKIGLCQGGSFSPSFVEIQGACLELIMQTDERDLLQVLWILIAGAPTWRWCNIEREKKGIRSNRNSEKIRGVQDVPFPESQEQKYSGVMANNTCSFTWLLLKIEQIAGNNEQVWNSRSPVQPVPPASVRLKLL